jgi:hypothetical protein
MLLCCTVEYEFTTFVQQLLQAFTEARYGAENLSQAAVTMQNPMQWQILAKRLVVVSSPRASCGTMLRLASVFDPHMQRHMQQRAAAWAAWCLSFALSMY